MKIISYQDSYRDDMIFMVLQAKDALGRKPVLNNDFVLILPKYGYREYEPGYMKKELK